MSIAVLYVIIPVIAAITVSTLLLMFFAGRSLGEFRGELQELRDYLDELQATKVSHGDLTEWAASQKEAMRELLQYVRDRLGVSQRVDYEN